MKKQNVTVRLYILEIDNIVSVDSSSLSDPYLII